MSESQYTTENIFGAETFSLPVALREKPNSDNLVIVEKGGKVYEMLGYGVGAKKKLFLDLTPQVANVGESGLLSIVFDPEYHENKTVYVFYATTKIMNNENQLFQRISKLVISEEYDDLDQPSLFHEDIMIEQLDDATNHQGGDLHFGPHDGYLYVSLGDGGGPDSLDNTQIIDGDFFSGILRIDVHRKSENLEPSLHESIKRDLNGKAHYKIPYDNPWVNATHFNGLEIDHNKLRAEFIAVGFRNPWRMNFDENNDLWIGDVGGKLIEEINVLSSDLQGVNFGWPYLEGRQAGRREAPNGFMSEQPIVEIEHSDGQQHAIVGGLMYSGTMIEGLTHHYIYSDYSNSKLYSYNKTTKTTQAILSPIKITAFGKHPISGEVLICNWTDSNRKASIEVLKLGDSNENELPLTLTETGAFSNVVTMTPENEVEPYEPNVTFWSDYALKKRWFSLPDPSLKFGYSENGAWSFPEGTVWIKHFDLEMERGKPETKKRIETRFLVKTENNVYGLSYQWNESETEAYLVPSQGNTIVNNITIDGVVTPKEWTIPSRSTCLNCHHSEAGYALSFNTRQLNKKYPTMGDHKNMIKLLYDNGYLDQNPGSLLDLVKVYPTTSGQGSMSEKLRSYLDVNCAYCHVENGPTPAGFDVSYIHSLAETGLVNTNPNDNLGNFLSKLLSPGDSGNSMIYRRISVDDEHRMPPIATSELDHEAIHNMRTWIDELGNHTGNSDWLWEKVGEHQFSSSLGSDSLELNSNGSGFIDDIDNFSYYFKRMKTDGSIIAKITSFENINSESRIGLMMRRNLRGDSEFIMTDLRSDRAELLYRKSIGELVRGIKNKNNQTSFSQWLKLTRHQNEVYAYFSKDGMAWNYLGKRKIEFPKQIFVGLAMASYDETISSIANVKNLELQNLADQTHVSEIRLTTMEGENIRSLVNNTKVIKSEMGLEFNFKAKAFGEFGSIQLKINGEILGTVNNINELLIPTASWSPENGDYIIEVSTFSGENANGEKGKTLRTKIIVE